MPKGKILFVDDDNFLRKVYQTELTDKGFEVFIAVDGEDGLLKVAEVKPDLIVLDIIMPKKNGFEVLAALKSVPETRSIPVVILTNLAQSEDQRRALDMGAVDYFVKDSTTLDVITEKITEYIANAPTAASVAGAATSSRAVGAPQAAARGAAAPSTHDGAVRTGFAGASKDGRGHNFCFQCGFKLLIGAKFCPDCGAQQENVK